jgi:hypothetical protein
VTSWVSHGTRFVPCEHHYVFFTKPPGAPVLILAVLHERMDLVARLKQRLPVTSTAPFTTMIHRETSR